MKIYEANGNRFIVLKENECIEDIQVDGYILYQSNHDLFKLLNKDGTPAVFSGNGIHCYYHYLYDNKYVDKNHIFKCEDKDIKIKLLSSHPFISQLEIDIPYMNQNYVDIGNHHYIFLDQSIDKASIYCELYDANISFISEISSKQLKVKTYEKGVGWTKSCGSGSIASSYYCFMNGLCESEVDVINEGGVQSIKISDHISHTVESKRVHQEILA